MLGVVLGNVSRILSQHRAKTKTAAALTKIYWVQRHIEPRSIHMQLTRVSMYSYLQWLEAHVHTHTHTQAVVSST